MIQNYDKPQVLINEVVDIVPQPTDKTLHAFIFGPQFFLHRYTNATERATMNGVLFRQNASTDPAARQVVPYEGGLTSSMIIDQVFAALYGENLEGELWSANSHVNPQDTNAYDFALSSINTPNQIRVIRRGAVVQATVTSGVITLVTLVFAGSGYAPNTTVDVPLVDAPGVNGAARLTIGSTGVAASVAIISSGTGYLSGGSGTFQVTVPSVGANVGKAGTSLIPELNGRPVSTGDLIYATYNNVTTRRTVRAVVQETSPSSVGTDTASSNMQFAASKINPTETDAASFGSPSAPSSWGVWLNHTAITGITVNDATGLVSGQSVIISAPLSVNSARKAKATLSAAGVTNVGDGDTVAIGSHTYTFKVTLTPAVDEVKIGASIAVSLYNLAAAINATGQTTIYGANTVANAQVIAQVFPSALNTDSGAVGLFAINAGAAANAITVVSTGTGVDGYILVNGVATIAKVSTSTLQNGADAVGSAWPAQQAKATVSSATAGGAVTLSVPGSGYFSGSVVRTIVTVAGSGYTSAPEVVFDAAPTGGITAQGVALLSGGTVVGVQIIDPGTGYTSAPSITFVGGGGASAAVTAIISKGVTFIGVNNAGTNYNTGTGLPQVVIGPPNVTGGQQASAVAVLSNTGTIAYIKITNPGSGYTSAPLVAIDPVLSGGSSATLFAAVLGTGPAVLSGSNSSSLGTFTTTIYSAPTSWNGLMQGASYGGQYGERYTVTVTQVNSGTPSTGYVRVRSASGLFSADNVAATQYGENYYITDPSLGGLVIELAPPTAGTTLNLGDQFSFTVIGKYMPLNLASGGELTAVAITAAGAGYAWQTTTAVVTAPPSGGVQATVDITVDHGTGAITAATISNPGSGYVYPPVITLANIGGSVTVAAVLTPTISNPVNCRDLIVNPNDVFTGPANTQYQITVLQGTNIGNTTNIEAGAIVRVTDTAGVDGVQQYTIVPGSYYPLGTYGLHFGFPAGRSTPSGLSSGTQAVAGTAVVENEAISSVPISNAGAGYESSPTVTVTGGGGSGAVIKAIVENGVVIDLEIVSGGAGYTGTPTVAITGAPQTYQQGLKTGDVYYINAVAPAANGPYSTIVLSGSVTDVSGWQPSSITTNLLNIDHRLLFTGAVALQGNNPPLLNWTAGSTAQGSILVGANLPLYVSTRTSNQWVLVKNSAYGRLFSTWRGLIPSSATAPISRRSNEDDIITNFGAFDADNPVCYGGILALRAAQGKPVYVASVPTNDLAGYQAVMDKAIRIKGPAYLAPMTMDATIKTSVQSHCQSSSVPNVRHFRRCYLATQNPGKYGFYTQDSQGNPLTATVLSNGSGNVLVTAFGAQFVTQNVQAGMIFRTQYGVDTWGNPTFTEYLIASVTEQDELLLVTGPASPISPATNFQIWANDTGAFQATFVGNTSAAFQDRRVWNTWTDMPQATDVAGDVFVTQNYYLAAEIAGARSVFPVQMGLTRMPMQYSVSSCPLMYTKYKDTDLNIAAANGTAIVTQDYSDGPVYIRHQLTTSTNSGPLYYEDSIGVALDAIAYDFDAMLEPYIGPRNANLENLEEIETGCRNLLDTYLQNIPGFEDLGPILAAYTDLKVEIPTDALNTVDISVDLQFPLPIDKINLTLRASTISTQTLLTINTTIASAISAAQSTTQTTIGSTAAA